MSNESNKKKVVCFWLVGELVEATLLSGWYLLRKEEAISSYPNNIRLVTGEYENYSPDTSIELYALAMLPSGIIVEIPHDIIVGNGLERMVDTKVNNFPASNNAVEFFTTSKPLVELQHIYKLADCAAVSYVCVVGFKYTENGLSVGYVDLKDIETTGDIKLQYTDELNLKPIGKLDTAHWLALQSRVKR